jgi:hypothetical protein
MRSLKWLKPLALGLWIHLHALLLALSMILTWVVFDHDVKRTLWIHSAIFGATMIWCTGFLYYTRIPDE